jgi:hypothetical protein
VTGEPGDLPQGFIDGVDEALGGVFVVIGLALPLRLSATR